MKSFFLLTLVAAASAVPSFPTEWSSQQYVLHRRILHYHGARATWLWAPLLHGRCCPPRRSRRIRRYPTRGQLTNFIPPCFCLPHRSQQVGIYQGGTQQPDGSVCCSKDAPQCKVQLIGMSGTFYADGDNNRTRFDSQSQGLIVNWYHPVNKQMAVVMGADAQHWHCQPVKILQRTFLD